jgi:Holliday junction DNA helicase RuvA
MIAYVRGVLAEKSPSRVVVEAAGVGYELLIALSTYERLPREGENVKLLAYHSVREDDEALFGFATGQERELFAKLNGVSGVGPKMALAILSGGSVGELTLAIAGGNHKRIAAVKGVGKKTAEKICLELKGKLNAVEALSMGEGERGGAANAVVRDAMLALSALGFGEDTANKMVAKAVAENPGIDDVERLVRLALSAK